MTQTDAPEVSVVIAAYNAAATLDEQLAALSRQDVPFKFEVLLCDNGSADGTASIARRWADRFEDLIVVEASARRGPGAARNIGVQQARGQSIAFCDADDVVADDWLHEMHRALQAAEFVAARIDHRRLNPRYPKYLRDAEGVVFPIKPLVQYPMVGAGHMGVHKNVFDEVGGFDESMRTNEDLDLSWRIQLAGHELVPHPQAVVHVRIRQTLPGVFRQAYWDGNGRRMLHQKYARVYAAHIPRTAANAREDAPASTEPAAVEGRLHRATARLGRMPGKIVKILRDPLELAPHARRVGLVAGKLLSSPDRPITQLGPDGRSPRLTH